MNESIVIGTAEAVPGTIQYGKFDALGHPTGQREFFPVIIAQGKHPGPCLWLTAGIHGSEHTGPRVIYDLIQQQLVDKMTGTLVAIPALSPAGLRTRRREPYHAPTDPNRLWPDGRPKKEPDPDKAPPSSLELAYEALFASLQRTADYLIDYHNAWIGSLSFVFRDRVLYPAGDNEEQAKSEALALTGQQDDMITAYGHTVVNEFSTEKYIDEKLHRSTSGAALLVGRIPSFTVELGGGLMPDPSIVAASAAGTRNVMRWAGMLPGDPEPIEAITLVDPGFPVRRMGTPRAPVAGVVVHKVEPGDLVKSGDVVAEMLDVWGRPLEEGTLRAEHEGFVIGRAHGIYFYPGDPVLYMAVRDDAPLVGPYPQDFFD
jgi:predicted deacylase